MDKLEIHHKYSNGQFKAGDQSDESRKQFYFDDFKICPKCQSKEIIEENYKGGWRWNGDGFGTDVFKCINCQWYTSFEYDEGGDYEYYYEPRWKKGWIEEKKVYEENKKKEELKLEENKVNE